jgi:hypothetical protein
MIRLFLIIPFLSAALFFGACERPQLKVYIAEKEPRPGLREANIAAFPKLGYVAEKPDLTMTKLKGVSYGPPAVAQSGPAANKPTEDRKTLVLQLTTKDADALNKLTSTHIGDRLLVLLNDDPLFAPEIRTPSIGQSVYITPPPGTDTTKIKAKLDTIVRNAE